MLSLGNAMKNNPPRLKRVNGKPGNRAAQSMARIEILEQRIAPATLVSPTVVTYTDLQHDKVTITATQPIFYASTVNSVLGFNIGAVHGNNSVPQQLETIDLAHIASQAAGTSLTVNAVAPGGGNGVVNVGFIMAATIDLGTVTVDGDLGRIIAGSGVGVTPGIVTLEVGSIGALGTTTQAAGGNLVTEIRGELNALDVTGSIVDANIGVGDPAHPSRGEIVAINIGGSIIGGATAYSGAIRATGDIGRVVIRGSITGGTGPDSGLIGTAGNIGSLYIDGSITGGGMSYSGAVLATGNIGYVQILGSITGGAGPNSGLIGTVSEIGEVDISGSIIGGGGLQSGALLSTGGMGNVEVGGSVEGGSGMGSGQVGTLGSLAGLQINGSLSGGTGIQSGLILSGQSMGDVTVNGSIISTTAEQSAEITSLFGNIGNIDVGGRIVLADIVAKGSIGTITANTDGLALSGIDHSTFTATLGSIGSITSTGSDGSGTVSAIVLTSDGILASSFVAGESIGNIVAKSTSATIHSDAIAGCTFTATAGSIGSITATTGTAAGDNAIDGSMFTAKSTIGPVIATGANGIVNSEFNPTPV
jgi:hypothetical protein